VKKSIKLSVIAAISVISMVGCGSSSSSSTVKTGIGYYVDSPVEGINYICGSKEGKTDSKGTFTFEEGKDCKFTLAGIPLRTTKADELLDGKKVFEGNPKVAKLLQSIDANNDLSDGIQITDAVLTALTNALEASDSAGVLPEGTVLTGVVSSVGNDVDGVDGNVKTNEEVQEHLAQSQTDITKNLLAGKTFYVLGANPDGSAQMLDKSVINSTVTLMTNNCIEGCEDNQDERLYDITIEENNLVFDDGSKVTLTKQTSDYLLFEDSFGKHYLYNSEAKAKARFKTLNTENDSSTLSDKIVGKTYYVAARDSYVDDNGTTVNNDHVETLVFNTDGKIYDTWTQDGRQQESILNYSIDGDTLSIITPDNGTSTMTYVGESDTYIRFTDTDSKEGRWLFFTYADAEKAFTEPVK